MLNAHALTTVARLKSYLQITVSTYDTQLEMAINVATDRIEKHCGRRFKKTEYTDELYTGENGDVLFLKNFPIVPETTVALKYRNSYNNSPGFTTVDDAKYFVDAAEGYLTLIGSIGDGFIPARATFGNVPYAYAVSYTAGYDFHFDDEDEGDRVYLMDLGESDLEMACWKLAYTIFQTNRQVIGAASEQIGDYQIDYAGASGAGSIDFISGEIQNILSKYRRITL